MCSVKEIVSEVKTVRLLFHLHKEHANRACKIGVKSVKRSLDILFSIGFRNVFTLHTLDVFALKSEFPYEPDDVHVSIAIVFQNRVINMIIILRFCC